MEHTEPENTEKEITTEKEKSVKRATEKIKKPLSEKQLEQKINASKNGVIRAKELAVIKLAEKEKKRLEQDRLIEKAKQDLEEIELERKNLTVKKKKIVVEDSSSEDEEIVKKPTKTRPKEMEDIMLRSSKEMLQKTLYEEHKRKLMNELFS